MASAAGPPVVILDDGEEEEIGVMAAPALAAAAGRGGTATAGVAASGPIDVDVEVVEASTPRRAAAAVARGGARSRPPAATDDAELVVLDAPVAGLGGGGVVALPAATPTVAGGGAAAGAGAAPGCDACGAAAVSRGSGGGGGGGGGGVPVPWVRVARCRHGLCAACALGAVASTGAAGGGSRTVVRDGPTTAVAAVGSSTAAGAAAAAVEAVEVVGTNGAAAAPSLGGLPYGGGEEGAPSRGEPLDDGAALLLDDVSVDLGVDAVAASLLSDTPRGAPAGAASAALEGGDAASDEAPSDGARAMSPPTTGDDYRVDTSPPPPSLPSVRADPFCPVGRCRAPLAGAEAERCLAAPDADALFGPVLTAFGAWYDTWASPKDVDAPVPIPPWLMGGGRGSGRSDGVSSGRVADVAAAGAGGPRARSAPRPSVAAPRAAVGFQIGLVLFDGEEDDGSWLKDDLPAAFEPLWVAEGGGLAAAVAAAAAAAPAGASAPPVILSVDDVDDDSEEVAAGGSPSAAATDAVADAVDPPPDPLSPPTPPPPPPQPPTWRCALCGGGAVPRPSGPAGRHAPAWVHCELARAVGVVEIVRALRKSLAYSSELESELAGADDADAADEAGGGGDTDANKGGGGGLEDGAAGAASAASPIAPDAPATEVGRASGKRRSGTVERTPTGRWRKRQRGSDVAGGSSLKARTPPQSRGFVKGTGYGGNRGPEWKAKGANLRARDAADDATAAGWLGRLRCFLLPPREAPPRAAAGVSGSASVGGGSASWPPYLRLLLRRTGLVTVLGHVFMNGSMMELGQRAVLYTASLGVVTALTSVASLSSLLTEHVTDEGVTVASLVDGMARQVRVLSAGAGAANLPPATGALVKQVRRTVRALKRADVLPGLGGGVSGGGSGGACGGGGAGGGGPAGGSNDAADGGDDGDGVGAQAAVEAAYVRAMKRLQFETVPDLVSCSTYRAEAAWRSGAPGGPAAKGRLLRLSQEVASLSGSLPLFWASGVLLRVDEDRFDVLRALVFGPEGTPYAHGAFVFDFFLPAAFPRVPPLAKLLTTGGGRVRFNPNLYKDGRVCLSLLGTWAGPSWTESSTLLQVLVSIQSLILVAEPYFNEPGYESSMGTPSGRAVSERYNVSVRRNTVVYAMTDALRRPPPEFRDALRTHFRLKAAAIRKTVAGWVAEGGGVRSKGRYPPGSEPAALTAADVAALEAELDKL